MLRSRYGCKARDTHPLPRPRDRNFPTPPSSSAGSFRVNTRVSVNTINAFDGSLWYVLASANALSGDAALSAGTVLRTPAVAANKNDATTFKAYYPDAVAIQRYDPRTGLPVVTELYSPADFLPKKRP